MLDETDIGSRVVVRRHAGIRDGRPVFRDVLGVLTAASALELTLLTRDGDEVTVPVAEIHRAKRIPPSPPRR
ncbi:hypothetical protein [Pilimelia columellifera]|uniref:Ferrous iron transport protein A n=1 Tax=Pilimelia columellifera subsp. columellifera TaxID=706583 RepID=A0ABN3N707_9ACTN